MIHDILDLLSPKPQFTQTGKYYAARPVSPADGAITFNYEHVNPYSATYRTLFGNVQSSGGELTVRTNDQLNFLKNEEKGEFGFVVLQDGRAYAVLQVEKDVQSANKQVLRLFGTPVSTDFILRLERVTNPWGVQ